VQCVLSVLIYTAIVFLQAKVKPFRQEKHNNCAEYLLIVNMLNSFSTIVFESNEVPQKIKTSLLYLNLVMMVGGWLLFVGLWFVDMYLYVWLTRLVGGKNKALITMTRRQIQDEYDKVDESGLVSTAYYDYLLLRNRYPHTVQRRLKYGALNVLRKNAVAWVGGICIQDANEGGRNLLDIMSAHGQAYTLVVSKPSHNTSLVETATMLGRKRAKRKPPPSTCWALVQYETAAVLHKVIEASAHGSDGNCLAIQAANSLSTEQETPLLIEMWRQLQLRNVKKRQDEFKAAKADGTSSARPEHELFKSDGRTAIRQQWNRFHLGFADFIRHYDPDKVVRGVKGKLGTWQEGRIAAHEDKHFVHDVDGLQHIKPVTRFMGKLYSKSRLCDMVLYLDYCIKHDLVKAHGLDRVGPGDIVSAALQFNTFFVAKACQTIGGAVHAGFYDELSIDRNLSELEPRKEKLRSLHATSTDTNTDTSPEPESTILTAPAPVHEDAENPEPAGKRSRLTSIPLDDTDIPLRESKFWLGTLGKRNKYYERDFAQETTSTLDQMRHAVSCDDKLTFLLSIDIFAGFDIAVLESLAEKLKPVVVLINQVVVRMGEVGNAMYFIHSGAMSVITDPKTPINEHHKHCISLQTGHFFGEMSLLGRSAVRTATIKGKYRRSVLLRLDREDLWNADRTAGSGIPGAIEAGQCCSN